MHASRSVTLAAFLLSTIAGCTNATSPINGNDLTKKDLPKPIKAIACGVYLSKDVSLFIDTRDASGVSVSLNDGRCIVDTISKDGKTKTPIISYYPLSTLEMK